MLSSIVESVLEKYLGKYIEGIKNNTDVSMIDGCTTIENASIKPAFINEFGLPFSLKYSHIDQIMIQVPWTKLKEKSSVINITGIYILFELSHNTER